MVSRMDNIEVIWLLPETLEQGHRELPNVRARPAAILDRSALVDFAQGDSERPETFQWREGAVEAIRTLNDRGYYVLVTSRDVTRVNAAMQERLAPEGAHVDRFAPVHGIDDVTGSPIPAASSRACGRSSANDSFSIGASGDDLEAARSAGFWRISMTEATSRASSIRSWLRSAPAAAERHPSPSD